MDQWLHPAKRFLLLPLIGALVLSLGLVSGASASQDPSPSVEPSPIREAGPKEDASLARLRVLIATPFLPSGAVASITRVLNERMELEQPGALCRRVLGNPHSPEQYVERCLAAFAEDGQGRAFPPGLICRRIASDPAAAPGDLVERCREWAAAQQEKPDGGLGPHEACRRIVNADEPDTQLVERCRAWLESTQSNGMPIADLCRRVFNGEEPDAELVERCRTWLASTQSQGMPVLEACRRALASERADEALVERCEALLEGRPQRPELRPEMRREATPSGLPFLDGPQRTPERTPERTPNE